MRLLHGAFIILVLKHTSQFRSFEKGLKILCFLDFLIPLNLSPEKRVRALVLLCPLDSVNSSNHSGRSRKRSSASRLSCFFLFYFCFSGPQFPLACSSLRSVSGLVDDVSCNDDVEDELVPELDDNPRTTRGTKLSVLHLYICISSPLGQPWLLSADPLIRISMFFAMLSEQQNCRRFIK